MKRHLPIVTLLACLVVFALGIVELFELRFEVGDVYPPYSSLRADPLGAMALYESLGKIPGVSVRRDFSVLNRLPTEPKTVYLHLAAEPGEWRDIPEDLYHEIRDFLARGDRLVIAYYPQVTRPDYEDWNAGDRTNTVDSAGLKSKGTNAPVNPMSKGKIKKTGSPGDWLNLETEWNFHEGFQRLAQDGTKYLPATVDNRSGLPLPATLAWHSGLVFTNCDRAWHVIYGRGADAVVMERRFGQGTVVLASDSYLFSNEAMVKDRHADLLAWFVGGSRNVVFDEAHLGITQGTGVAMLMRKYRLHGLAAGLLLLAGLFIWKNSTSLAPPRADESPDNVVAGRDSASGFINLLRRSIPPNEIFSVCFAEWKKSAAASGNISSQRFQQAQALFQSENDQPVRRRNPIATYQKISETLRQGKSKL